MPGTEGVCTAPHAPDSFRGLNPGIAMSYTGLATAFEVYAEKHDGAAPAVICTGLSDVSYAYGVIAAAPELRRPIVPVPGMPNYFWFVAGPEGIIWSNP